MLSKKIQELVLKVVNSALNVTYDTTHDVFVYFEAHIKKIQVEIFKNGWTDKYPEIERIGIYLDREEAEAQLQVIYDEINDLYFEN